MIFLAERYRPPPIEHRSQGGVLHFRYQFADELSAARGAVDIKKSLAGEWPTAEMISNSIRPEAGSLSF